MNDGVTADATAAPVGGPSPGGCRGRGAAAAALPAPLREAAGPRRQAPDVGAFAIRIARDGTWHYRGSPIARKELVCLFASVLRRAPDGAFWLETPVERGRIEVEDTPFVAVEMWWHDCAGGSCLSFRTNLDEVVTADAEHPIRVAIDPRSREPRPCITVRPGLEARISRAVFYELVALAQPERLPDGREVLGVWSEGVFFPIDEVPKPATAAVAATVAAAAAAE